MYDDLISTCSSKRDLLGVIALGRTADNENKPTANRFYRCMNSTFIDKLQQMLFKLQIVINDN